jgi:hypothetical protein
MEAATCATPEGSAATGIPASRPASGIATSVSTSRVATAVPTIAVTRAAYAISITAAIAVSIASSITIAPAVTIAVPTAVVSSPAAVKTKAVVGVVPSVVIGGAGVWAVVWVAVGIIAISRRAIASAVVASVICWPSKADIHSGFRLIAAAKQQERQSRQADEIS